MTDLGASAPLGRRSLVFFSAVVFLFWASLYVYVPILPLQAAGLGATLAGVGTVVAAYGIPQLLFRAPIGVWSDRVGRRRPFGIVAMLACILGAAGMGLAADPTWLAIFRFVTGVGTSFWVVMAVHYAAHYPPRASVVALGRLSAINSFAQFFANLAGGAIAGAFDFRAAFLTGAALAAVGLAMFLGVDDQRPRQISESGPAVSGLPWANLGRYSTVAALAIGVLFATTFGFLPVLAREIGMPTVLLGSLAGFRVLALGITSLVVHRFVNRIGLNTSIALGLAILAITTLGSAFAPEQWSLLALQVLGGAAFGLISPLTMTGSIAGASAQSRATAMGIYQATYSIGMVGMPAVAGVLADNLGLRSVFYVSATVCVLALFLCLPVPSWIRRRWHQVPASDPTT